MKYLSCEFDILRQMEITSARQVNDISSLVLVILSRDSLPAANTGRKKKEKYLEAMFTENGAHLSSYNCIAFWPIFPSTPRP